jgi:hypothetical protein
MTPAEIIRRKIELKKQAIKIIQREIEKLTESLEMIGARPLDPRGGDSLNPSGAPPYQGGDNEKRLGQGISETS